MSDTAKNPPSLIALEAAKEAFFEAKSMAMHAQIIQGAIDRSFTNYVKRKDVRPLVDGLLKIRDYALKDYETARSKYMREQAAYALTEARDKGLLP